MYVNLLGPYQYFNILEESEFHVCKQAAVVLDQIQSSSDKSYVQYPAILNLLETGQCSDVIIKVRTIKCAIFFLFGT